MDDEYAHALGPARAVGPGPERLAAAVPRQPSLARELREQPRRRHDRHTCREGRRALPSPEGLGGEVEGDERGRAGRVDGDGRAFAAEDVGQAAGEDPGRVPGQQMAAQVVGGVVERGAVLLGHGADVDAGPGRAQGRGGDAGPFEGLPRRLQEQSLLRVHRQGLARRDTEEVGVEVGGVGEEAAPVTRVVPAAIGRWCGDRVGLVQEGPPQALGVADATGQTAGHADDREGLRERDRDGRGGGGLLLRPGVLPEVPGERGGRGVVEQQGGGQGAAGRGAQPGAQFEGQVGVQPEILERQPRVDVRRRVMAQDGGGFGPHEVEVITRGARDRVLRAAPRIPGTATRTRTRTRSRTRTRVSARTGLPVPAVDRCGPVPTALEGIGRQLDGRAGPVSGEGGRPVHVRARDEGLGQTGRELLGAAVVAAQRGDDHRGGTDVFDGVGHRGGEHRVGTDLDEGAVSRLGERGDGGGEGDRLAQVPVPVGTVQSWPVLPEHHPAPVDRGVQGHPGGQRGDVREGAEEIGAHGLDAGGVGGVVHGDAAGAYAVGGAGGQQGVQRVGVAGHHDRAGAVDGGDLDPSAERCQPGEGALLGLGYGHHAAPAREPAADQFGAADGDPRAVRQGEHAGHAGRGDLPLRVPDDRGGLHPVRAPRLGEADHDGPQHGLEHLDPVEARCAGRGPQHLARRPVDTGGEGLLATVPGGGELRARVQEFHGHPGPLGALAREDEDGAGARPGGRRARRRDQGGGPFARRERREAAQPGGAVGAEHHGPVREERAGRQQGVADVGGRRPGVGPQDLPGLIGQCLAGAGGQHPRHHGGGGTGSRGGGGAFGDRTVGPPVPEALLLGALNLTLTPTGQHHMAVGAPQPERADPGDPGRSGGVRPGLGRALDGDPEVGQRDAGVRDLVVESRHEAGVTQAQHRLEEPRDAGGALQMPDVGLDRADPQGPAGGAGGAEGTAERGGLGRVPLGGSGAVEFDVLDVGGVGVRPLAGEEEHLTLGVGVGDGQGAAAAVVVDGAAADQAVDAVAVGKGVGEGLEDDQAAALAPDESVGAGVEGVAAAVRGEGSETGDGVGAVGRQDQVDAAGERERALAAPQALGGQVDGDERGGLTGVDRETGAAQAEGVREPVGEE
ncbi:hypothetical protein SBD_6225 [Streptomyces bottropensis ATCC 25435]|uniref:Uncharacterized protein n=1 Tax=Streptomyces bottropensis ATCC 25435 TaxID=1054862 RepID=M3ERN0_9ACTN|nr:hypothetical protein SBD_6225 [Streptomyces bottropensis ATCC 25435]